MQFTMVSMTEILADPRSKTGPTGMLQAIEDRLPPGTPPQVAMSIMLKVMESLLGKTDDPQARGLVQGVVEMLRAGVAGDVEQLVEAFALATKLAAERPAAPEQFTVQLDVGKVLADPRSARSAIGMLEVVREQLDPRTPDAVALAVVLRVLEMIPEDSRTEDCEAAIEALRKVVDAAGVEEVPPSKEQH